MRKLVTIRQISNLEPIPDATAIEVATVDGWKIVVKKGEFSIGDICVYFEIDSFLPIRPEFEFLRARSLKRMAGQDGFRLKTIRLRGQVSQGLLLPLSILGAAHETFAINADSIGADVTEQLGVQKYDPPVPAELAGMAKGNFPSSIPKTDQERVQNLSSELPTYKQQLWEVTEKLEGSSMTCYMIDGEFGVCSRNLDLKRSDSNTFWKVAISDDLEAKLLSLEKNIAFQGELVGEGIQGNIYRIKSHKFYCFDIIDIDKSTYYTPDERRMTCKQLGINHVPVLHFDFDLSGESMQRIIDMADGTSVLCDTKREGIVFKSVSSTASFKAISNRYLLGTTD